MADASLLISHARLTELLHYNAETGIFRWRVQAGRSAPGSITGTQHLKGYWAANVDKGRYYLHRLAWFYVYAVWPQGEVDHINGDKGDNRIVNLRDVSVVVNAQNRKRHQSNNKLGFLGVTTHEHKFRAVITVDRHQISLGRYDTPEEAHAVYLSARRKLLVGNTI